VQKLVIQNENVELGAQSAVIGLLAGPLESEKYPIVVNMFCKIQSLYRISAVKTAITTLKKFENALATTRASTLVSFCLRLRKEPAADEGRL
jgi:hypothetical protein